MVIFNSYVKLPEGIHFAVPLTYRRMVWWYLGYLDIGLLPPIVGK